MLDRYDQDLLLDYLEGELDADRRAQLDVKLVEDPQLAALLDEIARDRDALRSLPQAQAPTDLVHDVTNTLERQMLLDDTVDDTAPIPLSRGRALAGEPTRSISWGRVIGLTGLAASVALVAGILVITFDDTLERTANEFAASSPTDVEMDEASAIAEGANTDETSLEGLAALDKPDHTDGPPAPGSVSGPITDPTADASDAVRSSTPGTNDPRGDTPGINSLAGGAGFEGTGDQPVETLALRSAAAISAIQPRQQLVLFSESPEVSLEQLFEFCVANGIPVVAPDQQARVAQANGSARFRPEPGLDNNVSADGQSAEPIADYALLINESQLDSLVQSLNDNVTIDPKKLGKGSLISNQAALLTDLPEGTLRDNSADGNVNQALPKDATAVAKEQELFAGQQAIQLNKPDLGSPYANTRNAYNLLVQQQASYSQPRAPLSANKSLGVGEDEAGDTRAAQPETQPNADMIADLETVKPLAEADRGATAEEELKDGLAEQKAQDDRDFEQRKRSIDPTRGNWLNAHLPVSDTTPLLLDRRANQIDQPTKLVPVMIQRAKSQKVNTLRQRQQVEYASRGDRAKADVEAEPRESVKETEPADVAEPVEAEPLEAEPVKPAEPVEPSE